MKKEDFIYNNNFVTPLSGSSHWESPSNIALVKYWGKSCKDNGAFDPTTMGTRF